MTPSATIILPARNEAGPLRTLLPELLGSFASAEIIVVDDGSDDDTSQVAGELGATVVAHPYSLGNGAAIKSGARAASGDILVFMDADGQHDPGHIPRLLAKLGEGFDMVVGARQRGSQASTGRGIANWLYNSLASRITGHTIPDLTSGFRAVRATKFREFLHLLPNGFSYPTTITMALFRSGYAVSYVPITAAKRVGKSHIRPLHDGLRFLIIIFRVATLYSPLKIFVPASAALFLLGLGYYGYTYISQGRFTNMSALLLTTAIVVFLIGLVSEQITQLMYKE